MFWAAVIPSSRISIIYRMDELRGGQSLSGVQSVWRGTLSCTRAALLLLRRLCVRNIF